MQPAFAEQVRAHAAVRSVEAVEHKLVVALDDPEAHNPELIAVLVEAGARIQFVGELRRSLEDVYMRLVNSEA